MNARRCRSLVLWPLLLGPLLLAIGTSAAVSPASGTEPARIIYLATNGADRANSVAFSPDGHILAVGSSLGIYLYDSQTLGEIRFIPTETWVRSLAFSPNGETLATGSYDKTVRLWRVADGTLLSTLEGHNSWVRRVAFSPDGETLASASDDNTVRLWRVSNDVQLHSLKEGTEGVRAVAFSPDGEMLATGGYDNAVRLWRVSDGTLLHTLQGHTGWVRTIAFSSDGERLASGGFDTTARLWRVADGALIHTLEGHAASVLTVAFSPDDQILATGSVDTTLRLWRISDGALLQVLIGHNDFVFSASFAPNGKALASGAADNSVRLWEVEGIESASPLQETADRAGRDGQSCVTCHHPQGNYLQPGGFSRPPRVLENGCATCHLHGALVLNWCTAFTRSPGPLTVEVAPPTSAHKTGLPRGNRELSVVIARPANGEHFYSSGILAAVPVGGQVYYAKNHVTEIEVRLEIWSNSKRVAASTTRPQPNGYFSFDVNLSPDGIELEVPIEQRGCVACHSDNLKGKPYLPAGEARISVIALAPDGKQASDERWVLMDRGQPSTADVQVVLEGSGQPVSKVPVLASTILYEWRARNVSALTDANGAARLELETLTQAATSYRIEVPATVADGILYESVEPVEIILPPAATSRPEVTLKVRAQLGQIAGRLSTQTETPIPPLLVWAVRLPDGSSFRTRASAAGDFAVSEIPIGQYVITVNPEELAEYGLVSSDQRIDLSQSPVGTVELSLAALEGDMIRGVIRDADGSPLPFAWVTVEGQGVTRDVSPESGAYALMGLPDQPRTIVTSAPGYFSRADAVTPGPETRETTLVRRPETRVVGWGEGEVILPAESEAVTGTHTITLERGWLWGHGGEAQPLIIHTQAVDISIPRGRFALEQLAGQTGWFYLLEGQARIATDAEPEPRAMKAGEMLALVDGAPLQPVPLEPGVLAAIRPSAGEPVSRVFESSLEAQLRDRLAQFGIGAAQAVTFITYFLVILVLVLAPLFWIIWQWKRRARRLKP